MNCSHVERLLDDYVDGELSRKYRQPVEDHLRSCLTCRRSLNELRELLSAADRLPQEIQPETDLWGRIESRIQTARATTEVRSEESGSSGWRPLWGRYAAAAAVLIAIAAPFALDRLVQRSSQVTLNAEKEAPPAAPATERDAAMLARSEDGVLLPRADLLEALARGKESLPPETVQAVERDALLIDRAIAELRSALEENPDSRRLELLLAARYQQEVDLLKRVHRI